MCRTNAGKKGGNCLVILLSVTLRVASGNYCSFLESEMTARMINKGQNRTATRNY